MLRLTIGPKIKAKSLSKGIVATSPVELAEWSVHSVFSYRILDGQWTPSPFARELKTLKPKVALLIRQILGFVLSTIELSLYNDTCMVFDMREVKFGKLMERATELRP